MAHPTFLSGVIGQPSPKVRMVDSNIFWPAADTDGRYLKSAENTRLRRAASMHESANKMDLEMLNRIARSGFLLMKKLTDVEIDCNYMVTKLKQVGTKFGVKTVVELEGEFQVFLPDRVSRALLKDDDFFDEMAMHANKLKLFLTYLSDNGLEFSAI